MTVDDTTASEKDESYAKKEAALLRQAVERAKLMLDATPLGCTLWDDSHRPVECNEALVALFGAPDKAAVLADFLAYCPEYQPGGRSSADTLTEVMNKAFSEGRHVFECMHQTADGTPIPTEITLVRVRDAGASFVAGYTRDLREYRRMMREIGRHNQQIRDADERAKLMLDSSPLGCVLWNRDCKAIDCNEAFVKLFGYESAEHVLERVFDCSVPYQHDGLRAEVKAVRMLEKAFSEGRSASEWEHRLLDGTPVPSEVTMVRLRYGNDYAVVSYTRDLREHKRMMRKIERQTTLLRTMNKISAVLLGSDLESFADDLLRSMGILAKATDVDRVYVWKNHIRDGVLYCTRLYECYGDAEARRTKDFAVEQRFGDILPGWEETLARGVCVNGIVRYMDARKRELLTPQGILSILLVPIILKNQFWGFIGFDDCHNERVFTESDKNILRSASELIADTLSRNDMEENLRASAVQLRDALDEAQSANRAKGEFLARMSHEMRTPMNAIVGMSNIARATADADKKNACLEKIDGASKHLLSVINDVLDMSKIEANKLELTPQPFNFEKMLANVTNVLNFSIEAKKQKFAVTLDEKIPPYVVGDEFRLTQVITNLLTNAVKFTPEGGAVTLNAKCVEDDGLASHILIEVTDTGIGISREQQARLFAAFEQADGSIARKFGGTGLGLAISKHIVELMGGKIWVESELGHGAKFSLTVTLPKSVGEHAPEEEEHQPFVSYEDRCILIAEDMEINRDVIAATLEETGVAIDFAGNGAEAIAMFRAAPGKYSMILMDIQMPELDGYEATREIRALPCPEAASVPIVAMTANVFREDVEACLAAGMNDHIGKPLDPSVLFAKMRKYM